MLNKYLSYIFNFIKNDKPQKQAISFIWFRHCKQLSRIYKGKA